MSFVVARLPVVRCWFPDIRPLTLQRCPGLFGIDVQRGGIRSPVDKHESGSVGADDLTPTHIGRQGPQVRKELLPEEHGVAVLMPVPGHYHRRTRLPALLDCLIDDHRGKAWLVTKHDNGSVGLVIERGDPGGERRPLPLLEPRVVDELDVPVPESGPDRRIVGTGHDNDVIQGGCQRPIGNVRNKGYSIQHEELLWPAKSPRHTRREHDPGDPVHPTSPRMLPFDVTRKPPLRP